MKTDADYFTDWEAAVFGFGYGSGEEHTIGALKGFMSLVGQSRDLPNGYDYSVMESGLGPQVAWLLINVLCHDNIIEYGTSPRFGWLTPEGERLKAFMDAHSLSDLMGMTDRDQDYVHCHMDYCNCEGEKCKNPFWRNR